MNTKHTVSSASPFIRIIGYGKAVYDVIRKTPISNYYRPGSYTIEPYNCSNLKCSANTRCIVLAAESLTPGLIEYAQESKNKGLLLLIFTSIIPVSNNLLT